MDLFRLSEERILEGIERGEFDNLEGSGRKIDLTEYFNTPAEFRVGYQMLKANKFVPGEVGLMKEIRRIESKMEAGSPDNEHLRTQIAEKQLELSILLERNHRGSRRR